jgi:hypothetical protein
VENTTVNPDAACRHVALVTCPALASGRKREATVFAQLRLALHQAVGMIDGAGINSGVHRRRDKHQALVTNTGVQVNASLAWLHLRDVVALLVVSLTTCTTAS